MLRITVRNPAAQLLEINAQETTVFQTTRGPLLAAALQDQASFPETPDHIHYKSYCSHDGWFMVVMKETV